MDASHRSVLRRNRVFLAQEMDPVEVSQILIGENVFSDRMVEEINANKTTFDRNVAFLNKLPTRGPRAFSAFYNALIETEQRHLARVLIPDDSANTGIENLGNVTCLSSVPTSPPSSFSFLESTPAKHTNQFFNPNSEISSISPTTTPKTCKIQSTVLWGSTKVSPPSNFKTPSPPVAVVPSEADPARVPVEHMDVNVFDEAHKGQSPTADHQATVCVDFESLRSNASIESLKIAAGVLHSNHFAKAASEHNHSIKMGNTSNSFQQICTDAPSWETVQVRHTTPEFLQSHIDSCYPLYGLCKGVALIINVTEFEKSACLDNRLGGEKDRARLELMFQQLSYEVYRLDNGTAAEMYNTLQNFALWPRLKEFQSCFIVLMSHGEDGVIFGRDGRRVILNDAYGLFSNENCLLLQNKPKVFLVQACRGEQPDKGTDQIDGPNLSEARPVTTSVKPPKRRQLDFEGLIKPSVKLPRMSDCLFAYATVPGYAAMRNTERGSWFIQAFIQNVAFHAKDKSILDIMTLTNNQVKGREGWSPGSEFHRCKEMSEFTSSLCRDFYFFPGIYLKQIQT